MTASRIKNILFAALFVCGFLFSGLGVLVWYFVNTAESTDSPSWPTVRGQVTQADIDKTEDTDNDTIYGARVVYSYRVNGEDFSSSRVSLGQVYSQDISYAEKTLARYQVGQLVTVYYNPQKPERAVLEPGSKDGNLIPFVLGAFFTLIGLAMAIWFVHGLMNGRF